MKRLMHVMVVMLVLPVLVFAADAKPVKPSARDKCPVCGMFVAKYPDFVAEIVFKDGSYAVFDGVKDMMRFYLNPPAYVPTRAQKDFAAVYVTDYYSLDLIDGSKAHYVIGSDVYGPMGRELIPFASKGDAEGFQKDHKGKAVLTFRDITVELLKTLE